MPFGFSETFGAAGADGGSLSEVTITLEGEYRGRHRRSLRAGRCRARLRARSPTAPAAGGAQGRLEGADVAVPTVVFSA